MPIDFSLGSNAEQYKLVRWQEAALFVSGWMYSKRHWQLAKSSQGIEALMHRVMAVAEILPILGGCVCEAEKAFVTRRVKLKSVGTELSSSRSVVTSSQVGAPIQLSAIIPEKVRQDLGNRKILVSTAREAGYGNLICMLKIASMLHERLGIPTENILLSYDRSSDVDFESLNTKYHFQTTGERAVKERGDLACRLIVPFSGAQFYPLSCPTLCIPQYGHETHPECMPRQGRSQLETVISGSVDWLSMGLSAEKNKGILISDELRAWGFSPESKNSQKRIEQLANVSPQIKRRIFDKETIQTADLVAFDQRNRLYYGYASQCNVFGDFIEAVGEVDKMKNSEKNIVIVSPISPWTAKEMIEFNKFQGTLAKLRESGIGRIEIKAFEQNGSEEILYSKTLNENSGKTMTIVVGSIPFEDTTSLWKASEKETVVTGDQSLSEAISANKTFAYETLTHKWMLADEINADFSSITGKTDMPAVGLYESTGAKMSAIFCSDLGDPKFTEFNRHIIERKNCSDSILEKVAEMIAQPPNRI